MWETSKLKQIRKERGDFDLYLKGSGIDIGSGNDPLLVERGMVRTWDLGDGDALELPGVLDESFDFVYSSHTLEHMNDVPKALSNWTRVLRPGGYLYLVVPDYILYEKMMWPSVCNTDHLASFSFLITRAMVGRDNHYHVEHDLFPLLQKFGCAPTRGAVEDYGFDYNLGVKDQTWQNAVAQICIIAKKG